MRLDPVLRSLNYAVFAVLIATGAIWLVADQFKASDNGEMWQTIAATMLMLHGTTAMAALVLFGMMVPLHIRLSWCTGRSRITGAAMVGMNAVLVVTASGLYYAGSDLLRALAADMHIAVGLALPALIVAHIAAGRRAKALARQTQSKPDGVAAALRAVTFSKDPGFR